MQLGFFSLFCFQDLFNIVGRIPVHSLGLLYIIRCVIIIISLRMCYSFGHIAH